MRSRRSEAKASHHNRGVVRKRFGQHFLEAAWVRKVVDAASPAPDDRFLEIGPGRGALTLLLAPRVRRLVAIEIDRDLAAALSAVSVAQGFSSALTVVPADFLDIDLASLVARELGGPPVRVIGNLPYNVSSPILFKLIASGALLRDATLMLQREVADRLLAPAGSGDYGVLSILVAVHARVSRVFELPPGAFRPPPKVRSTLVRLEFHPPAIARDRLPAFERLVRGIFQQRRKTLTNALRGAFPELDPARLAGALTRAGVEGGRRPETLETTDLSRLAELIHPAPETDPAV